jgi:pimeloyl-ACP methyl ester carboxylesterase
MTASARLPFPFAVLALSLATPTARGAPAPSPATPPAVRTPLGIALEELASPFPVRELALSVEGQDVRMAYYEVPPSGPSNGRAVLLLHGKNFWGAYWEGPARALSAAGFRVIVPDQLGFGKSSKPDIHYSFDGLASNTARLLDVLGVRRAVVVGHSMGGMLAVRFARNYPERTEKLVLENPIGLEDYRFLIPPTPLEQLYRDELEQTPEAYLDYIRHYFVHWDPKWEGLAEVRARLALSGEFPRWARSSALTYQMIYQQPVRHELPLIAVPALLIIGQADRTAVGKRYASAEAKKTLGNYPALGRAAAKDIPGAKLVEIPGVGHIPHLEAEPAFERALLDFLR